MRQKFAKGLLQSARLLAALALALGCFSPLALIGQAAAPAAPLAVPGINEFVVNHTGTDTAEFVEIFGLPSTDYSAYTLLSLEGDGAPAAGTIDRATTLGATDANGYWSTGFLSNAYENGTMSLLLVQGFTGAVATDLDTNDDGVLDATPWTALVDSVAVTDLGAGDQTYGGVTLTPSFDGGAFIPGGASRIPNGTDTDAPGDWVRNEFDGAGLPGFTGTPVLGEAYNTPLASNWTVPVINEFVANHVGTDTNEYVEVLGGPGVDYSSFTLLSLEGDGAPAAGTIDRATTLGTASASGYWTTGFINSGYENGTMSLLLVQGFTGTVATDLDTNDDGILDSTPWAILLDSVAVNDLGVGDQTYGGVALTPSYDGGTLLPGGASRIPNGADTNAPGDWMRNDFDGEGLPGFVGTPVVGEAYNTPGVINQAVLPPNDLVLAKSGPSGILAGEDLVYTLQLKNFSPIPASGVVLTDTLPSGVSYLSDTSGITPTQPAPGTYVWSLGTLPAQVTTTIFLTATSSITLTPGVITNQAQVTSTLSGDDPANNSSQWATTVLNLVTIYDIQTVPDPATSDVSPYAGQTVAVEGIVTSEPGDIDSGTRTFVIQDALGGPWSGLVVFSSGGFAGLSAPPGTRVRVTGQVQEYYGLTELVVSNGAAGVQVISTGHPLPAPVALPTGDYLAASSAEQWEGVLIEFQNATVTNANLGYGEWAFSDGSGATAADDLGELDGDLTYLPTLGDVYQFIRGIGYYSFGVYKLVPRSDLDIQLKVDGPAITKDAPSQVAPGGVFTYTISVENLFTYDLTGVVITDRVPADTTFAYALDGGVESGGEVMWSIPTLPALQTVQVRFAVTAALSEAYVLNDQYAVYASNFVTPTFGAPLATVVGSEISIHHIQGAGDVSPFVGRSVTSVDGVVTSLMNNGFFMQEVAPDVVDETSEGIFVFTGAAPVVEVGEGASVDGLVNEYFTHTQLDSTQVVTFTTTDTITPTEVDLPVPVGQTLEPYEGMLVTFPEELTASQNYFQGRYGQITLSSDGRMYNPTNGNGLGDTFELDLRRMIILDDSTTVENVFPIPYIGQDNTHRAGDTVSGLTGVIDYGEINSSGARFYRLQPVGAVTFTRANPRTAAPEVISGTLKVASFNVLNYFNGDGLGGGFPTTRGASTLDEFIRQRTKIITAMLAIDADIYGLIEIENDGDDALSAIQDLVNGLNDAAGAGTFALVADPPFIGTDEIKQAFIYRPARVTPVGSSDSSTDPVFSRPPVAQTFQDNASGEIFTAVVNHFKSKGSCPADPTDPNADQGDGQGCWNLLRVQQAQALLAYIDTLVTASGDPDVLVIGDLNAYGEEDPILTLVTGGLTNELAKHVPAANRYSYIFDGLSGYLDHALSTGKLDRQITGATIWHINTDEPSVIDYNTEFKSQDLYTPTPYRSSDHDPVVIGITPGILAASFESNSPVAFGQTVVFTNTTTGLSPISYQWNFGDQTEVITDVNPTHRYTVVGSYTVVMTATNPLGTQVVTGTVQVTGSKIFMPQVPQAYNTNRADASAGWWGLTWVGPGVFAWLRRRG
jgi:uncharacterized repeat protein (TIGR01451 family)